MVSYKLYLAILLPLGTTVARPIYCELYHTADKTGGPALIYKAISL